MAFWDLADNRYREARTLLIFSAFGLILGPAVLLWLYWPTLTAALSGRDPVTAGVPAAKPTAAETARHTVFDQTRPWRDEMLQAVQAGNFERALEQAKKILEVRPGDEETWSQLAGIHRQMGDLSKAIAAYDRAMDLAPEPNDHYFYQRALLHRQLKDYPAALRDMKEAARLDPASADISNHLLILQLEGGEEQEALATMRSNIAMNLETQKPMWLMALAAQLMREGSFAQARDALAVFKANTPPAVYASLAADPFFDPYRENSAVHSFLQPAPPTPTPAPKP